MKAGLLGKTNNACMIKQLCRPCCIIYCGQVECEQREKRLLGKMKPEGKGEEGDHDVLDLN